MNLVMIFVLREGQTHLNIMKVFPSNDFGIK